MDPDQNPDPGYEHLFKIYWFVKTKNELFKIIFILFSLNVMLKFDEPFRDKVFDSFNFFKQFRFGVWEP